MTPRDVQSRAIAKRRRKLGLVVALAAFSAGSVAAVGSTALAITPICVSCLGSMYGSHIASATANVALIEAQIIKMEISLLETIWAHAGEVHQGLIADSDLEGGFIDATSQAEAVLAKQELAIDDYEDFQPSDTTCQAQSATRATAAAEEGTLQAVAQYADDLANWSRNTGSSVMEKIRNRFADIALNFCDYIEVGQNVSPNSPAARTQNATFFSCYLGKDPESGQWVDARAPGDVQIKASAATKWARIGFQDTTNSKAWELQALQSMLINSTDPLPPSPIPPKSQLTIEGQMAALSRRATDAQMNVAQAAMAQIPAMRVQSNAGGAWAMSVREGMGLSNELFSENISEYDLIETLVSTRLKDPNFYKRLQKDGRANAIRNSIALKTSQLMLKNKTRTLMEHLVSVEATDLARRARIMRAEETKSVASMTRSGDPK